MRNSWGFSSAGRAPALHAGGQEFESPNLHHKKDNDICYCPFYFECSRRERARRSLAKFERICGRKTRS